MKPALEHPIQHLLARLEQPGRVFIGLAGCPGSGKSTFAAHLAEEVNARTLPHTMVALGMDGFHLSRAQLAQFPDPAAALARRGAPWTFDARSFISRLNALREATDVSVSWPGFDHAVGDPTGDALQVAPATRLVLVEGIWVLHANDGFEGVARFFDERWFLDTPSEVAQERLAQRHQKAWGISREEALERIRANDALNAVLVRQNQERADWRVMDLGRE